MMSDGSAAGAPAPVVDEEATYEYSVTGSASIRNQTTVRLFLRRSPDAVPELYISAWWGQIS